MAIKRIDELAPATPLLTDFVPATPAGGPSTKATVGQISDVGVSSGLIVSYTGSAPIVFPFTISHKSSYQNPNPSPTIKVPNGIAIDSLNCNFSNSSALTFSNLGEVGTVNFQSSPLLKDISFPELVSCGAWTGGATMPLLDSLSFPLLKTITGVFFVTTGGPLTTVSMPLLMQFLSNGNFSFTGNFTSLSFPSLQYVQGSGTLFTNCPNLATASYPSLERSGSIMSPASCPSLTSFTLPALNYCGNSFTPNIMHALTELLLPSLVTVGNLFSVRYMNVLANLYIPLLNSVGGFQPNNLPNLVSLSAPSLTNVGSTTGSGSILISAMGSMTSFTLPAIETIGAYLLVSISLISDTAALTTFTIGSSLKRVYGNVILTSCALNQASVDSILVRLAALDGTGATTAYSTKTVTITGTSATPSATGLSAKATLVARGCTVTHN